LRTLYRTSPRKLLRWWKQCTCMYSQRIAQRSHSMSIVAFIFTPFFLSTTPSRGVGRMVTQRCFTWMGVTQPGEPWTTSSFLPLPCVPSPHTELLLQFAGNWTLPGWMPYLGCVGSHKVHKLSFPDQGNGSLLGMQDSHPGEFSNCGQSLLTVTSSDGTWKDVLWYILTCSMRVTSSHGTCKCGVFMTWPLGPLGLQHS